ncbi:MAG TPA: SDR family oxidoreductase [Acidobacteriaceae bacterium]|nr:SDR family oxidoreductase [Acidobacteriaceae bacterium]
MKLAGRKAIVTGASAGLGYAIAQAFVAEGASIVVCGRSAAALQQAFTSLSALARSEQQIRMHVCDVSSESQVYELVRYAVEQLGNIQILVNNAGVQGPIGRTEDLALEDWRRTFEVNFYGTLFACRALLPHLRTQGYGKILNLSGGGAASPRPFFSAYATSKAAVVRLTENLAEELRGTQVDVNAIAPGALNTQMLEQTLAAGREKIGEGQFARAVKQKEDGGSSMEKAAALCVYLASAASDGITGRLISAPWDPWPTLHEHGAELSSSDIYTLRRIVPSDRAKQWD